MPVFLGQEYMADDSDDLFVVELLLAQKCNNLIICPLVEAKKF